MIDLGLGWLWAIGAGIIALAATWLGGRKAGKTDAKMEQLKNEARANDRINQADLGIGASDADNQRWLREFHDKHRN